MLRTILVTLRSLSLLLFCVTSLVMQANVSGQTPVIWESNFGEDLNLSDDSTSSVVFDTFAFPFGGRVFSGADVLDVSSNGFVSLGGSNGNACCNGNVTSFLNDAFPRISPLWGDIDPANVASDGVFFNTFNDDADVAADRLAITWDAQHWGSGQDVLFQLQLYETGDIVFGYNGVSPLDRNTLIGVGTAGGISDPGASDLSVGPFLASGNAVYELFASNNGDFDLDFSNTIFSPIPGTGQFVVTQIAAVPEPSGLGVFAFACLATLARRRR